MRNILFYKFVELEDLDQLQAYMHTYCASLGLLGKILIAKEGINGCVSGTDEATQKLMDKFRADERFSDMDFKIGKAEEHTFRKLIVRQKPEIIRSKFEHDVKNAAPYIEPAELKELIENEEVILVDARNNYESKEGTFAGAIAPDIKIFSEWPQAVEELKEHKHKKIVTFCTGGIRCEKASAYMVEQGFTDVHQLHGGILNYGKEFGNEHWEGKCFVFDKRVLVDLGDESATPNADQCMWTMGYQDIS